MEHFACLSKYMVTRVTSRETRKTAELFTTVWGSWYAANIDGNREVALVAPRSCSRIGKSKHDPGYLLRRITALVGWIGDRADIKSARAHYEAGLSHSMSKEAHRDHAVLYGGHDPAGLLLYSVDALVLSVLGHPDRALAAA